MNERLVILSDNRTRCERFATEHGLSIYMETVSGKYLLDTGASDLFIRNAKILGVDLADVDYCLISHGHNDHIGGLSAFLEINTKAKVILSADIPGTEYLSVRRFRHSITGNVDFEKYYNRFIFIRENTTIGNVHVYANIDKAHAMPLGNNNLLISNADGEYVPDIFHHELAYVIDGVLFTGCAHNGILNILEAVTEPIKMCIGGFHLLDGHLDQFYETEEQLSDIASYLAAKYPSVVFYTGHCTGENCYTILSRNNDNIHQFYCGEEIDIKIKVIVGDITKLPVEAIVNAANCTLLGGGGVDGAIHRAAGIELLKECMTLGSCETGQSKITGAYNLPCKYVIHTVGPIYDYRRNDNAKLLASCYKTALDIAQEKGIKSIAFPCISTGAYGYPKAEASLIALKAIKESTYSGEVIICCFCEEDRKPYLLNLPWG